MKIQVNRIPEEGLKEHASYDPAGLDMARWDIQLPKPFEVDAFVTKADQEVIVDVDIRCPTRMSCSRCLEEFDQVIAPEALFTYSAEATDVVDITDDVRQEILLAFPMIPVCRPDCKGLCSVCGQNLNAGACPHHAERGQP